MKKERSAWDNPQNAGSAIGSVLSAPGALAGGLIGHAMDDSGEPLHMSELIGGTVGGTLGPVTGMGGMALGNALRKWMEKEHHKKAKK